VTEQQSSGDRMLAVLQLFTVERPQWTVEDAAAALGVSAPTAYRYFKRLTKVGLISPVGGTGYGLGPAIIQLDRLIEICDPLLGAGRRVMMSLVSDAVEGSTVLLNRLFRDRVMCIHQVASYGAQHPVCYERGLLMPLFRGASAKIILAHLAPRRLTLLFARHAQEIAAAGLGNDRQEFGRGLAKLRRARHCISRSEFEPGRLAISAPIFDAQPAILGSVTFVLPAETADEALIAKLAAATMAGARAIEGLMNANAQEDRRPAAAPPRMAG
jgi:DNA-binding IclR family transcriptional regulator